MKTNVVGVDTGDDFLYAQIAERFASQIENNILKAGDKLLSLRALSREQGISLSTAYKAYVELENKGFIEARPKSGYVVKFTPAQYPAQTLTNIAPVQTETASVDDLIRHVYKTLTQEGIIRLSLASPSAKLIPGAKLNKAMAEVLRVSPTSCTQYEDIQGNLTLRKQIAKHAFNWNGQITENDIVTTQGCMEALVFCLKAVTEPGDTVAIESPTYFGIFNVMKSLGLKVLEIPVDPENGADLEYLANAMETVEVKACLFVPNFCNPTGALMPDHRKKQLVEMLGSRHIPLIEDDIYGEMYFGKTRPRTCKSYDKEGIVMLCSSVSKTLAPGYRVGWCIPGKFLEKVISLKFMHTVSAATPTQAAIALFFETGRYDLHMRNLRKALHTQCLRYIQLISEYFPKDIKLSQPKGGYVLWIELNARINSIELFNKALKHNVSVAPGQIFTTDGRYKNYIRVSVGEPITKEIEAGLKMLGQLIEES
ncbi:PLP-dependent aminotransferase family protein [Dyadobacter sp. CY312]|uniref:aminotransferase-like domain-containing protein n=1 Tax=Dyadobacter sp. CY312 TaxID=2907303 RepID=UPI001F283111|nr:PLP-dependent aminotransferase family protein [Dyadobacter sp. CY312]MCE7039420.1 PLP-dependent aminotransferase family protein [Dyadobacter sp. CY312]